LADAVLPAGSALNWDKTRIQTLNAKRSQLSLDCIWRFPPAADSAVQPPTAGLGLNAPLTRGMDADDLRDWTGSSTLIAAYPESTNHFPHEMLKPFLNLRI
jgi:hypothetical protein